MLVAVGDAVRARTTVVHHREPGRRRGDVHAPPGRRRRHAGARDADEGAGRRRSAEDLFEHNAVANKEVLNAGARWRRRRRRSIRRLPRGSRRSGASSVLGLTPRDFKQQVTVRSPLSGKVLELSIVPGEYRNDTSAPVMTIADLSTVWVSSQVPETYIRFIQPHERVEIRLIAYPDETFEGHVRQIADTVDPQTRTVKVHAEMDNRQGRFRPEMFGSIHHIESTTQDPGGSGERGDRGRRALDGVRRIGSRHVPGAAGRRRQSRRRAGPHRQRRRTRRDSRRRRRHAVERPHQEAGVAMLKRLVSFALDQPLFVALLTVLFIGAGICGVPSRCRSRPSPTSPTSR